MINDPATKIGRPRQVYTGYTERDYVQRRRSAEPGRSSRLTCAAGTAGDGHAPGMTTPPCCGSAATCGSTTTRRCSPRRGR